MARGGEWGALIHCSPEKGSVRPQSRASQETLLQYRHNLIFSSFNQKQAFKPGKEKSRE